MNILVDISNSANNAFLCGATQTPTGLKFDGVDDKAVLGDIGNIKSIAFRIKPDSTTEKLMEGAANDKLIHINAGVLTYPEFDNGYVNGIETNVNNFNDRLKAFLSAIGAAV